MDICPQCGSNRVHRSRSKGFIERFRRDFSSKRLFRCHACGWRGWGTETERPLAAVPERDPDAPPPDMDAIDRSLTEARKKPDEAPDRH